MSINTIKTPWLNSYGDVPAKIEYSKLTMFAAFEKAAQLYPNYIAYEFFGKKTTYSKALKDVIQCAKALTSIGIATGDRVTICLPNCPQAITMFYAVNMIGAIDNMIHPLSSIAEIEFFLQDSNSTLAITLDQFYDKFEAIKTHIRLPKIIITSIKDALTPLMAIGYQLTQGRKIKKVAKNSACIHWNHFLHSGTIYTKNDYRANSTTESPAVVLYSGGTTGQTKGILLSNFSFNAVGDQIREMSNSFVPGDSMLAVMPIFHGFGLGVSIHAMLMNGATCILVPRFTVDSYAKLIKTCKPNYIAGVPTLYEALLRLPSFNDADLSCLKGVFSGGDSLSIDLKKRFDIFLKDHKSPVKIREGYGSTECLTASCLTPYNKEKEGSIGIPLPDMYYKIVAVGTETEVPYNTEGEICIAGPTLMLGYVNQPEETAKTLRKHADGFTWLHTGDLGTMDEEGFIYFKQRIKRMIVTNGYNVYPSLIERTLDAHEAVHMSCVIGIKDPIKIQRVKAFIVLAPNFKASNELKKSILDYCKEYIAKYALPQDIDFRTELPKTKVGKIAYRELEEEENAKLI